TMLMLLCGSMISLSGMAQNRQCGAEMVREIMTKKDPSYPLKRAHMQEHIKALTRAYEENAAKGKFKTTGPVTVPVVFHVVLDATDQNALGGINGIRQRAMAQI